MMMKMNQLTINLVNKQVVVLENEEDELTGNFCCSRLIPIMKNELSNDNHEDENNEQMQRQEFENFFTFLLNTSQWCHQHSTFTTTTTTADISSSQVSSC
jgi:hypothetical protein